MARRDRKSIQSLLRHLSRKINKQDEDFNATASNLTIERAINSLNSESNTFLFLNLMATHAPYTFNENQKKKFLPDVSTEETLGLTDLGGPKKYLSSGGLTKEQMEIRERIYDASINYLDGLIEEFYEKSPNDTLFVLIGDHGELIGEHKREGVNLIGHHFGTFDELIDVPCIFFSKSDFQLDVDEDAFYDQTQLLAMIKNIFEGSEIKPKEAIISEYYGRAGFNRQFNEPVPEEFRSLFERKSFSIVDDKYKLEISSNGKNLYSKSVEISNISDSSVQKDLEDKIPFVLGTILDEENLI